MKLDTRRLLIISVVVTAIAFLTAGLLGNDRTGAVATIADISWFVFMIGFLVTAILAVTTLVQSMLRRSRQKNTV